MTASKIQRAKQAKPSKRLTISRLIIQQTSISLSYTSEKLHLVDLASGSLIELLNLINLDNLVLDIKSYDLLRNKAPLDRVLKSLLSFYLNDLLTNQKVNIARAIGPIRSLVNIAGAFYSLVERPYSRGLVRGMGEGISEFYGVVAEEGAFIAGKVFKAVTNK